MKTQNAPIAVKDDPIPEVNEFTPIIFTPITAFPIVVLVGVEDEKGVPFGTAIVQGFLEH